MATFAPPPTPYTVAAPTKKPPLSPSSTFREAIGGGSSYTPGGSAFYYGNSPEQQSWGKAETTAYQNYLKSPPPQFPTTMAPTGGYPTGGGGGGGGGSAPVDYSQWGAWAAQTRPDLLKANDLDLYGFDATPLAQVGVRLSHLAGDGDLVVYGPATDRPGNSPSPVATRTATPATPPLQADALDVSGAGYSPEPDTDAGVPLIDGLTVVGRSAARNTDLEAVDAIEPDLLQVSSYNTSVSNLPYVLRVRQVDPPNTPTCTAYGRTGGVAGTLPDLTALPADLATIFLVNRERLGDTFGPTAANDVISALATLAARPDVKGLVVPVEGDASVASAYAAWNANPCASDRANKVVSAITRLVMGL